MAAPKKNAAGRIFDSSDSFRVENYRGTEPNLAADEELDKEMKPSFDAPKTPLSPQTSDKKLSESAVAAPKEDLGEQLKHSEQKRVEFFWFVSYGVLLTVVAGYMNSVSILVAGIPAAHVSGTSSKTGILLGQDKFIAFSDTFLMIPSFIFGAFVSSQLVTARPYHMSRDYNKVFLLGTVVLLAGFLIEVQHDTSATRFGSAYVTAFACGLQNAASSIYSNNLLRTTHVTGTATDIGILIGRALQGQTSDLYRLYVFIPLLVAYIIGGAIGAASVDAYGNYALAGNVIAFGGTGLMYYCYITFLRHTHHPRMRAASYSTTVDAGGKPVMMHIEPFKKSKSDAAGTDHGDVELADTDNNDNSTPAVKSFENPVVNNK